MIKIRERMMKILKVREMMKIIKMRMMEIRKRMMIKMGKRVTKINRNKEEDDDKDKRE